MNWVSPIKDDVTLRRYEQELMEIDPKYFIMFRMGVGTGMQLQELLKLSVEDVRNKDFIIVYLGTKRIRRMYQFEPDLKQAIDEFTLWSDKTDPLFPGIRNQPLSREQCYRAFKAAGQKLGLGYVGAQTMRKTFAWRYYKNTGDIFFLTHLLSHSSPAVTYRFIGEMGKAAAFSTVMSPEENILARRSLIEDGSGIERMEQIKAMLDCLEKEVKNPGNTDSFYGRMEKMLHGMEELIREFCSESA